MKKCIAERKLLYSLKGSDERKEMVIRIGEPYLVENDAVNFPVTEETGGCSIEFQGLEDGYYDDEVYGADLLQALHIAADVDPFLEMLSKKYDFYFPNGEPYFESDENT